MHSGSAAGEQRSATTTSIVDHKRSTRSPLGRAASYIYPTRGRQRKGIFRQAADCKLYHCCCYLWLHSSAKKNTHGRQAQQGRSAAWRAMGSMFFFFWYPEADVQHLIVTLREALLLDACSYHNGNNSSCTRGGGGLWGSPGRRSGHGLGGRWGGGSRAGCRHDSSASGG